MTAVQIDRTLARAAERVGASRPATGHEAPLWPLPDLGSLPVNTFAVLVAARVIGILLLLGAIIALVAAPSLSGPLAVGSTMCLAIVAAIRYAESGVPVR